MAHPRGRNDLMSDSKNRDILEAALLLDSRVFRLLQACTA